jgi:hypothetical protein
LSGRGEVVEFSVAYPGGEGVPFLWREPQNWPVG